MKWTIWSRGGHGGWTRNTYPAPRDYYASRHSLLALMMAEDVTILGIMTVSSLTDKLARFWGAPTELLLQVSTNSIDT